MFYSLVRIRVALAMSDFQSILDIPATDEIHGMGLLGCACSERRHFPSKMGKNHIWKYFPDSTGVLFF